MFWFANAWMKLVIVEPTVTGFFAHPPNPAIVESLERIFLLRFLENINHYEAFVVVGSKPHLGDSPAIENF